MATKVQSEVMERLACIGTSLDRLERGADAALERAVRLDANLKPVLRSLEHLVAARTAQLTAFSDMDARLNRIERRLGIFE